MAQWQYLFDGHWLPISQTYTNVLDKRYERPSLDTLSLKMDFGTLFGVPETREMSFRVFGDHESTRSRIRRGPEPNELSVVEVKDGDYPRILSTECREKLFKDDGTPKEERLEHVDGSERFVCEGGDIFQEIDGTLLNRTYENSGLTKGQMDDITKTSYSWQFKGPFRWERMRTAVQQTCDHVTTEKAVLLRHLFSGFDPTEDTTEYGPSQFGDYLSQNDEIELAIAVMDNYHQISCDNWYSFSAMTSARIENARSSNRPMVIVKVKGHMYMLLFDSGSGASGAGPVLIRPMRYQKILETIEEQFEASSNNSVARRGLQEELYNILVSNGQNPSIFLVHALQEARPYSILPDSIQEEVGRIMNAIRDASVSEGGLSTRIQQFMPALLEKFKECEVRLSSNPSCKPKKLALKIARTLKTGLSVPKSYKCDWRTMIEFINQEQAVSHTGAVSTCDICMGRAPTLKHCGTSSACLKCWVAAAVSTNMSCPFCRQDIKPGQLKLQSPTRVNQKRKRVSSASSGCHKTNTIETILNRIREDQLYKDIVPETSFAMKKWFVILLRRGLVKIHQRPNCDQAAKSLKDAAKIFKLM